MSKPEGITQEAWDEAEKAYWVCNPMGERAVSRETIARAIMAAKEEEREACAQMVETFTPIRPAFETEDEGGIKWPHPAVQQPIYSPEQLAAAIRKREG